MLMRLAMQLFWFVFSNLGKTQSSNVGRSVKLQGRSRSPMLEF